MSNWLNGATTATTITLLTAMLVVPTAEQQKTLVSMLEKHRETIVATLKDEKAKDGFNKTLDMYLTILRGA